MINNLVQGKYLYGYNSWKNEVTLSKYVKYLIGHITLNTTTCDQKKVHIFLGNFYKYIFKIKQNCSSPKNPYLWKCSYCITSFILHF